MAPPERLTMPPHEAGAQNVTWAPGTENILSPHFITESIRKAIILSLVITFSFGHIFQGKKKKRKREKLKRQERPRRHVSRKKLLKQLSAQDRKKPEEQLRQQRLQLLPRLKLN